MDPILTDSRNERLISNGYDPVRSTEIIASNTHQAKSASIPVCITALIACLGSVSFGYALEYASPALPELEEPSAKKLQLDQSESAWFTVFF